MATRREGMTFRKCGCIYFEHGPPVVCDKHAARTEESEVKQLRAAVRAQAYALDHDLTDWVEYESRPGKWTCYCHRCGRMVIVYDKANLTLGDQISGKPLEERCS